MSNRIKGHNDHTKQSIFHHGIIKLIACIVLQEKRKTWDYFLFWSGFHNEKEDQPKKRQMNKQYSMVKRLKKEVINELVKYNVQEECSTKEFEEPVCEGVRDVFHGIQEHISNKVEENQRIATDQEVTKKLL